MSLQEWIVDAYAKSEFDLLMWQRNNQKQIRADLYNGIADAVSVDDPVRGRAVGRFDKYSCEHFERHYITSNAANFSSLLQNKTRQECVQEAENMNMKAASLFTRL